MQKKTKLADRITKLRGLTDRLQGDAARLLGVAQQTLSSWETGRSEPGAEDLGKLADLYNVTADYLIGRYDHPHGLAAGSFLIDLDVVDAFRSPEPLPPEIEDPLTGWAVSIPTRFRIVGPTEYARLAAEMGQLIARKAQTRRQHPRRRTP